MYEWQDRLEWPYALRGAIELPPIDYGPGHPENRMIEEYAAAETRRHATRLILALEAWKLQHGELPERLDALVGPYFDRLPVDPYSGEPFRYFREGVKIAFPWNQYSPTSERGEMPANTPFIWSIGAKIEVEPRAETLLQRYRIALPYFWNGREEWGYPKSEYELWQAGWPFPIP
jgi:hypothetical protein